MDNFQAEAKCCNTGYYLVRRSAEQKKHFLTINWKGEHINIPIHEISSVSLVTVHAPLFFLESSKYLLLINLTTRVVSY